MIQMGRFYHRRIDVKTASVRHYIAGAFDIPCIKNACDKGGTFGNQGNARFQDQSGLFRGKASAKFLRNSRKIVGLFRPSGHAAAIPAAQINIGKFKVKFLLKLTGHSGNGAENIDTAGFTAGMQMQTGHGNAGHLLQEL